MVHPVACKWALSSYRLDAAMLTPGLPHKTSFSYFQSLLQLWLWSRRNCSLHGDPNTASGAMQAARACPDLPNGCGLIALSEPGSCDEMGGVRGTCCGPAGKKGVSEVLVRIDPHNRCLAGTATAMLAPTGCLSSGFEPT